MSFHGNVPHFEDTTVLFAAIKDGDVSTVMSTLARNPYLIYKPNTDGAVPIHAAYLHKQYYIGKEILTTFPECALAVYGEGIYSGENILHIAIVHRAFQEVDWLLERFPQLLDQETLGSFFHPGGTAYFGGYPLLFAVATNQPRMLKRILAVNHRNPSGTLGCCDHFRNNAYHIAIAHDLGDMWEYLLHRERSISAPDGGPTIVPLCDQENKEHLTPLALAGAMGRYRIVQRMMEHRQREAWVYGPIRCILVPMRGIEQPRLVPRKAKGHDVSPQHLLLTCVSAGPDRGITNCIKMHHGRVPHTVQEGRLRIAAIPEIRKILDAKWEHFGRNAFWPRFIIVGVVMVLWTAAIIIPNSYTLASKPAGEGKLPGPPSTALPGAPPPLSAAAASVLRARVYDGDLGAGFEHIDASEGYGYSEAPTEGVNYLSTYPVANGFIIAFESCVLTYVVWTILKESLRLLHSGVKRYFAALNGVVRVMYVLRMTFCVFVLIDVGLRAGWQYNPQLIVTSIAILTGWMYFLLYFVAFFSTGPYLTMIYKMATVDLPKFFAVFLFAVMGFATALALLRVWPEEPPQPATPIGWLDFFRDLIVIGTINRILFEDLDGGVNAWLFNVLLVVYAIFTTVTMMSILIATLENRFREVHKDAESLWYQERNNLMEFLESDIGVRDMYSIRCKYGSPLVPQPPDAFDVDLYLKVTSESEGWKLEVAVEQQLLVEARARLLIQKEEAIVWADILEYHRLDLEDAEGDTSVVPRSIRYSQKRSVTSAAAAAQDS